MIHSPETVRTRVLNLLLEVQRQLGDPAEPSGNGDLPFAELLDSMAMVEFIGLVAESCGVSPKKIEACVSGRFTTVGELAASLRTAGLIPNGGSTVARHVASAPPPRLHPAPEGLGEQSTSDGSSKTYHSSPPHQLPGISTVPHSFRSPAPVVTTWLGGAAMCLPDGVEPATSLDIRLGRKKGWLERRAGIHQRHVWSNQDPLTAAASAGRRSLQQAELKTSDIGAVIVTSEAPPLLAGLAMAIHHRLKLRPSAVALEIGGACTGFLTALWAAQSIIQRIGNVLVVAIEAATRHLHVKPGSAGEGAALFGDGAAAAVFSARPTCPDSVPVREVFIGGDGSFGGVLQIERASAGDVEIRMKKIELAGRAIDAMAHSVQEIAQRHRIEVSDLAAVVAHGGNGRMPALLARRLGISVERIWSETPSTGNLGSASIPVAWASRALRPDGPVVWTAAGAGLTWGAALLEPAG
jgi:3-oxoacyl-[acyl-carrier-protein] synthase-3